MVKDDNDMINPDMNILKARETQISSVFRGEKNSITIPERYLAE